MKDLVLPLRTGYYNLLNNMVVGGKIIPVFDMQAPYPAQTPYVIIEGIVPISDNTKDSFNSEVTVDLLVYTTYQGDFGGSRESDLITNEILQRVIPTPGRSGVSAAGFNVYMAKQIGSNSEMSESNTKNTYRRRLTIEHLVEQI